jgi:hypothetical protein
MYLRYDRGSRIILIERQFIPRTPLENTKDGKIKDLEDLRCMWCKSYEAYYCFIENTDHIIADGSMNRDWDIVAQFRQILHEYDLVAQNSSH